MKLRARVAMLLAAATFALALAGCGANGGGNAPDTGEHAPGHGGHAEHEAGGATDNATADGDNPGDAIPDASATGDANPDAFAANDDRPGAPDAPAYTLDAEVEQREDGFYLLVETNLKLSKEHYGRSPVEGEGHIHLYINGSLIGPITALEPVPLTNLKEGENVVRVELAQNNHSVIAGTSKSVRFEVAPPEN